MGTEERRAERAKPEGIFRIPSIALVGFLLCVPHSAPFTIGLKEHIQCVSLSFMGEDVVVPAGRFCDTLLQPGPLSDQSRMVERMLQVVQPMWMWM